MSQHFGKYILLEKVGSGGMAELFMAKQTGLKGFEKMMVIKRILPHLTEDPEFVSMFINEAKLAALLTHENIVQIFDLGHIENTYFIAMEYIMGKDLRTIQTRGKALNDPLSIDHALLIISKVCAGLDYAHRKKNLDGMELKLVHRDVSPQNILVSYDASVKLVDFGIAKAASQSSETATGMLKGKLAYMAPEQAYGKPIDCRADVFAIGIVLYEVLTGKKLFKGENDFNTLERVRQAKVEPLPSSLNKQVSPELEAIVLKALAKNREDRYQTASDLQADIEDHMSQKGYSFSTVRLAKYLQRIFKHDLEEDSQRFHSGSGSAASNTATVELDRSDSGRVPLRHKTPTHPSRRTRLSSLPGRQARGARKKGVSSFFIMLLTMGLILGTSVGLARVNPPFLEKLTQEYSPVQVAVSRLAIWPENILEYGILFKEAFVETVGGKPPSPSPQDPLSEPVAIAGLQYPNSDIAPGDFAVDDDIPSNIESDSFAIPDKTSENPGNPKKTFTLLEKKEIRTLLADAKTAYGEGRLDEVERMLNRLIDLNPTIPVTYHLLGMVRKERKDPEGALIIFAEASRRFPDYALLHYDLGFLYFKNGLSTFALEELTQGIEQDPTSPLAGKARSMVSQLQKPGSRPKPSRDQP